MSHSIGVSGLPFFSSQKAKLQKCLKNFSYNHADRKTALFIFYCQIRIGIVNY